MGEVDFEEKVAGDGVRVIVTETQANLEEEDDGEEVIEETTEVLQEEEDNDEE